MTSKYLGILKEYIFSMKLRYSSFHSYHLAPNHDTYNFYKCKCGSLDGKGVWGRMDTCICTAEFLHCLPGTITTLLISYTPVQNKKLKKINVRIWGGGVIDWVLELTCTHLFSLFSCVRLTLCDPMDYCTSGFPVLHHLLEFAQTLVH